MRGLSRYCEMLLNGGIVPGARFEILVDTPGVSLGRRPQGVRPGDRRARHGPGDRQGTRHRHRDGRCPPLQPPGHHRLPRHARRGPAHDRVVPDQRGSGDGALGRHHPDDRHQSLGHRRTDRPGLPARPRHGPLHQRQGDDPLASTGGKARPDRLGLRQGRQPHRRPGGGDGGTTGSHRRLQGDGSLHHDRHPLRSADRRRVRTHARTATRRTTTSVTC